MCPRYQLRLGGVMVLRRGYAPTEIPWRWLHGNRSGAWRLRPELRELHPEAPRSIFLPSELPRAAWRLHVRQARQDLRRGALRRSLVVKSDAAQWWSIAAVSLAPVVLVALLPCDTRRGNWRELIDFSHDWPLSIAALATAAMVTVPWVLLAAWAVHRALVEHRAASAPDAASAVHFEATGLTVERCSGARQQFAWSALRDIRNTTLVFATAEVRLPPSQHSEYADVLAAVRSEYRAQLPAAEAERSLLRAALWRCTLLAAAAALAGEAVLALLSGRTEPAARPGVALLLLPVPIALLWLFVVAEGWIKRNVGDDLSVRRITRRLRCWRARRRTAASA